MSLLDIIKRIKPESAVEPTVQTVFVPTTLAPKTIQEALAVFKIPSLRKGQGEIIDAVMKGSKGVLAVCPTSFGKSLTYQLPSLLMDDLTIVVSPLIALMKDQVDKLRALGISTAFINSSLSAEEMRTAMSDVATGRTKILYVAPERFENQSFKQLLEGMSVGLFAIDEAHCISKFGHDFRPSYSKLGLAIKQVKPRQVLAVTATATVVVQDDICRSLNLPEARRIVRGIHRPNLHIAVRNVPSGSRSRAIKEVVDSFKVNGKATGIIYTNTRNEAELICKYLEARGTDASFYHAGMGDKDRSECQNKWAANGGTIVATCAFGMGIDKSDVRFVVHSGLSPSVEDWWQACIHLDSMVLTSSGYKKAKDVCIGDLLITFGEDKTTNSYPVLQVFHGKSDSWIKIRTRYGFEAFVTSNHPIFSTKSQTYKDASSFVVGDTVLAKLNSDCIEGHPIYFLDCVEEERCYVSIKPEFFDEINGFLSIDSKKEVFNLKRRYDIGMYRLKKRAKLSCWKLACSKVGIPVSTLYENVLDVCTRSGNSMKPPLFLNSDFGWLLGIMDTDGHLKITKSKMIDCDCYKATLGNTNFDILNNFKRIINSYGLHCSEYIRKSVPGNKTLAEFSFSCEPLIKALMKYGLKSGNKTRVVDCPEKMLELNKEVISGFLAGCFDGDGNYSKTCNQFRLHSASWDFVSGFSKLLRKFGIIPKIIKESYKNQYIGFGYCCSICGVENLTNFLSLTAGFSVKTQPMELKKVKYIRCRKTISEDVILEIESITRPMDTINFSVDIDNNYFVNGILTHNCGRAGRDGLPSLCTTFWDEKDFIMQMRLIETSAPDPIEVNKFWAWLKPYASRTLTAAGSDTGLVGLTQAEMADESKCRNASGCVSFLRRNGIVETLGRGKYSVKLNPTRQFDFKALEALRADKIAGVQRMINFYRIKSCRVENLCKHFGDDSFEGVCGTCDNCLASKR